MDEQQTKRYRVVSPLLSDGDHYKIDDTIDLPEDRGGALVKLEVLALSDEEALAEIIGPPPKPMKGKATA